MFSLIAIIIVLQEIDELLSGSLTQEDEDAVLEELEEMTKVAPSFTKELELNWVWFELKLRHANFPSFVSFNCCAWSQQ